MKTKIIKSKNDLRKLAEKVSVEEGLKIADKLIGVINEYKDQGCFSLSAPQIGINKAVCIVNITEPKVFINPEFNSTEETDKRLIYRENCLSFPNQLFWTLRFKDIKVKADNYANELFFSPLSDKSKDNGWTKSDYWNDLGILESCYLQQSINLLNGKFPNDPEFTYTKKPEVNKVVLPGRNEKVMIQRGSESQFIKYKNALSYLEQGWVIV